MSIVNHRLTSANYVPSPNRGGPLKDPVAIILHYTAGRDLASSTRWLCDPRAKASAHLVVGKDVSTLNQLVPFNVVAWHAGESRFEPVAGNAFVGLNRYAIGVELDNVGPLLAHGKDDATQYRSPTLGVNVDGGAVFHGPHKHGGAWVHWAKYPDAQIARAVEVVKDLLTAYPTIKYILGHDDIAPGRKFDPGPALDLEAFRRAAGLGSHSLP